jgi:hypothetical protein
VIVVAQALCCVVVPEAVFSPCCGLLPSRRRRRRRPSPPSPCGTTLSLRYLLPPPSPPQELKARYLQLEPRVCKPLWEKTYDGATGSAKVLRKRTLHVLGGAVMHCWGAVQVRLRAGAAAGRGGMVGGRVEWGQEWVVTGCERPACGARRQLPAGMACHLPLQMQERKVAAAWQGILPC